MITTQDINSITPADARAFVKACNGTEFQRQTAFYWSGIITESEYFLTVGDLDEQEVANMIQGLKVLTATWLAS
jgi:hypothetical protein